MCLSGPQAGWALRRLLKEGEKKLTDQTSVNENQVWTRLAELKPWEDEFMFNLSGFAARVQSNTQI